MRGKKTIVMIVITAGVMISCMAWSQIVINELYYDSPGTDQGCFTELKGPPGTSLDGYVLVGVNGNGGSEYASISLSGHSIPTDGYFVVAQDNTVPNYDMIDAATDWQNANYQGTGEGDNVILRLSSTTVDAVGYGTFTGSGVFVGEGEPAPDVTNTSIGRVPDGVDTNNNAADFAELSSPTPGATNGGGPPEPTVYDCGELQVDDANGEPIHAGEYIQVTATAIVANGVFDTSGTNFYIQDDFGGVNIHNFDVMAAVSAGDQVTILGTLGNYNGLTQVDDPYFDCTVEGSGSVPDPVLLTTQVVAEYGEDYESTLARLEGCEIVGGDPWPSPGNNANILIDDGSGQCTMRIDKDTNIDEWEGPTGAFDLVGIITQYDFTSPYDEGYQILPRSVDDFSPSSGVAQGETNVVMDFKLMPLYPNPFNPGTTISFQLPDYVQNLKLSVFDIGGRLVTVLYDAPAGPGEYSTNWNAGNLASGTYFVTLNANNKTVTRSAVLIK